MTQGSAITTGAPLDVYIQGDGFFQVKTPAGQGDGLAYTRTGRFFANENGDLVLNSNNGYKLDPPINVKDATQISIGTDGRVLITKTGSTARKRRRPGRFSWRVRESPGTYPDRGEFVSAVAGQWCAFGGQSGSRWDGHFEPGSDRSQQRGPGQ